MANKKKKWEIDDEEHYVGNFFGWDVSIAGAVVMGILIIIILIRWFSLPPEKRTLAPPADPITDTISLENR